MISPTLGLQTAYAQPSNMSQAVESNVSTAMQNFDSQRAIALAISSQDYTSAVSGLSPKFNSIFETWSFDEDAAVTLDDVNVVFSTILGNGTAVNVVVTEDSNLTVVRKVSTQNTPYAATSINWSGYTMTGNAGGTTRVDEAYGSWVVPSVVEPQAYWCWFAHCDFSLWPGLTGTSGGGTGIVQGGTNSGISCSPICNYFYYAWYEFFPNALVQCSMSMNSGDSVTADVVNHHKTGGDAHTYDIVISDLTRSTTCSVLNQSFTNFDVPYYAQFIGERFQWSDGSYSRLPKFGSLTLTGTMYYGGASHGIYSPYSSGWYTKWIMTNGGNTNIQVSSVTTTNTFTQTWLTSAGT